MSRHKRRLQRLTISLGGNSTEELQCARLDRMTDEEIVAEVVENIVKLGFDEETARADPDAAIAWADAELDRIARLAVEAGFGAEMAQQDRLAAVKWYEDRFGPIAHAF